MHRATQRRGQSQTKSHKQNISFFCVP
uniref:Uncharacterized protein n=1 Tax=Anguilla anguilla TaxID=7936 RepID=A0A0E9TDK3_ANGAN